MAWHPFRNFGLKALAVVLATILWMTVTRDQLVERSLRVPLEFQNIPEDLEIIGDSPTAVDVRVRGPSSILSRLEPGEVVAVLDLRSARTGQRLFHLLTDEVRVPFGIEVSQVNPPTVPLTFERSATRMVPVVPTLEGEPRLGFTTGKVTVDPPTVEIAGPVSRLNEVREATTEPVSIDDAASRVRDSVTIGVADPALRLRVARNANVSVDIVPAPIERAVRDVPVAVRNLARGVRAVTVPPRVTVVLRGRRETLGALDAGRLGAWVDAASLGPGRYTLPLKLDPSRDFSVSRVDPDAVEVRIR